MCSKVVRDRERSFSSSTVSFTSEDVEDQESCQEYGKDGYLYIKYGFVFKERYFAIRKLGWGHFSTVWLCYDLEKKRFVAVKFMKSKPTYIDLANDEITILKTINNNDRDHFGFNNTLKFFNYFKVSSFNGLHVCIVFEVTGCNLLQFLKNSKFQGVTINVIKNIARDVLKGLVYLHDNCKLIHTDIKPENIVVSISQKNVLYLAQKTFYLNLKRILPLNFVSSAQNRFKEKHYEWNKTYGSISSYKFKDSDDKNLPFVLNRKTIDYYHDLNNKEFLHDHFLSNSTRQKSKCDFNSDEQNYEEDFFKICDFGNACYFNHHFSERIQTCEYQSPEVIVNIGYDETADIWSLACTLYELYTGDYLFYPKGNDETLKDLDHLHQIKNTFGSFDTNFLRHGKKYDKFFGKNGNLLGNSNSENSSILMQLNSKNDLNMEEHVHFANFLTNMLVPDPKKRLSARRLLSHKFLE